MAPHAAASERDAIPVSTEETLSDTPVELVERAPDSESPSIPFRRDFLFLINAWLVFHLFAILVCPASVEPSSPLARSCFDFVAPYLHTIYLDHGFHFFAPDPGPSTLVTYKLEFADGTTKTGRIPDRSTFPRLLYHRYFMLTEFLGNGPEESQPFVERALARNLCRDTGALRVSLTQIVHELPTQEQVRIGRNLNDPTLFTETALGTYTAEELRLPYVYPAAAMSDIGEPANAEMPDNLRDDTKVTP
ncbi:hypothetical protein [Schlesneria paludicola]|uniref:hypothetical protein n=1 Tax=Schlesneria paludicola TaxID=360056 RepID=UPI00029B3E57|nr:hypothetical protein [Schlesneria paludicola]